MNILVVKIKNGQNVTVIHYFKVGTHETNFPGNTSPVAVRTRGLVAGTVRLGLCLTSPTSSSHEGINTVLGSGGGASPFNSVN